MDFDAHFLLIQDPPHRSGETPPPPADGRLCWSAGAGRPAGCFHHQDPVREVIDFKERGRCPAAFQSCLTAAVQGGFAPTVPAECTGRTLPPQIKSISVLSDSNHTLAWSVVPAQSRCGNRAVCRHAAPAGANSQNL